MIQHRYGEIDGEAALCHQIHQQKYQPASLAPVAEGKQQKPLDQQGREEGAQELQRIGHGRTGRVGDPCRPIHRCAGLQRCPVQDSGYPAFAAFCYENDPIRIRYAMVTEGMEPHPACVTADQVAPHGCTVGALRGAGVPALRHRRPQRVQQLAVQCSDLLLGVAPIQPAVCVIPVSGAIGVPLIIPLFQKIEVIWLLRGIFHQHL